MRLDRVRELLNNYFFHYIVALFSLCIILFLVFIIRLQAGERYNILFVDNLLTSKFDEAKKDIQIAKTKNLPCGQYYANSGLLLERKIATDSLTRESILRSTQSISYYNETIRHFQNALELVPFDDNYLHNLGWLYYYTGKSDSAKFFIEQAIKYEPNEALYHVSLGLMSEAKNKKEALIEYCRAVQASPDILFSVFFKEFKGRQPELAAHLIEESIQTLEKSQDPISLSKLGVFYYYNGNGNKALELFDKVTEQLPNLSRPWYYRSIIAKTEEESNLRHSIYLNQNDFVSHYKMGEILFHKRNWTAALAEFKITLKLYRYKNSSHSIKSHLFYHAKTLPNDIIPSALLYYTIPLDLNEIFLKISSVYLKMSESTLNFKLKRIYLHKSLKFERISREQITMSNLNSVVNE